MTFGRFKNWSRDTDISVIGGKGKSLVYLAHERFPVPDGGCLSSAFFLEFMKDNHIVATTDQNCIMKRIQACPFSDKQGLLIQRIVNSFDGLPLAVRSSCSLEDMPKHSFAGQYESVLNVIGTDAVAVAIKTCWASLFSDRAQTYRNKNEFSSADFQMAIVIQRMVKATYSGVAFSVNPQNGNDTEIVVEWTTGLGDVLVSGHVTPQRVVYDWFNDKYISREAGKLPNYFEELFLCVRKIQASYGFPVDVEWVIDNDQVFVVQVRPITVMTIVSDCYQWTSADLKDGGVSSTVCTPLMASLYRRILETSMPTYLKSIGLLNKVDQTPWSHQQFGRIFWNATAVKKAMAKLPGFIERNLDEEIGIPIRYSDNGCETAVTFATLLPAIPICIASHWQMRRALKNVAGNLKKVNKTLATLENVNTESFDWHAWKTFYRSLINKHYHFVESTYFNFIYNSSTHKTLFKDAFDKRFPGQSMLALMGGLGNVSHLRLNQVLWQECGQLNECDRNFWKRHDCHSIVSMWQNDCNNSQFKALTRMINQFYYKSTRELDISTPTFDEDPSFIVAAFKSFIDMEDQKDSPEQCQQDQFKSYKETLDRHLIHLPLWQRRRFRIRTENMRQFLWWREELRDSSTKMYYHMRRLSLSLGSFLKTQSVLSDENEIFQLSCNEIIDILDRHKTVIATAPATATILARNVDYYRAFRAYKSPSEIDSQITIRDSDPPTLSRETLSGIACSPGQTIGTARIVKDISEIDILRADDILVTCFTDPAWTPVFHKIKGVITETGGILAHAAIVARECAIPAVLAVENATLRIEDGQRIALDGSTGEILLDPGSGGQFGFSPSIGRSSLCPPNRSSVMAQKLLKIKLTTMIVIQNIQLLLSGKVTFWQLLYAMKKQIYLAKLFDNAKYVNLNGKVFIDPFAPYFPSRYFTKVLQNNSVSTYPLKPNYAQISITNKCPCRCFHCHVQCTQEEDLAPSWILDTIDAMQKADFPLIFFVGGEPFSRFKDLVTFVKKAAQSMDTRIFTSGVGATKERLKELKDAGLEGICISLDHFDEAIHNKQRKHPRAYQCAIDTIEWARELGFYVSLVCCTTSRMVKSGETFKMVDFAESLGAHSIQINEIRPVGEALQSGDASLFLSEKDKQMLIAFYKQANRSSRQIAVVMPWYNEEPDKLGCTATSGQKVYIDSYGNVQPCELLDVSVGNIQEGFSKVWQRFTQRVAYQTKGCIIYDYNPAIQSSPISPLPPEKTYQLWPQMTAKEPIDMAIKIPTRLGARPNLAQFDRAYKLSLRRGEDFVVKCNHWLPKLLRSDYFTFGRTLYARSPESVVPKHEYLHLAQFHRFGRARVMGHYLFHITRLCWKHRSFKIPFAAIPFESEARIFEQVVKQGTLK